MYRNKMKERDRMNKMNELRTRILKKHFRILF